MILSISKKAKYWTNPQFLVKLENNGRYKDRNESSILIALMQKDGRLKRKFKVDNEYMQYRLFKVNDLKFKYNRFGLINIENLKVNNEVKIDETLSSSIRLYSSQLTQCGISKMDAAREITKRFTVEPGYYVIIPSTYYEGYNSQKQNLLNQFEGSIFLI